MKLTIEQVERIATLARLDLPEEEKESLTRQLSSILEYVDMLGEVDTADIEPMAHSIPMRNVFGDDIVSSCSPEERQAVLENFPERQGDLLKVPAVFS